MMIIFIGHLIIWRQWSCFLIQSHKFMRYFQKIPIFYSVFLKCHTSCVLSTLKTNFQQHIQYIKASIFVLTVLKWFLKCISFYAIKLAILLFKFKTDLKFSEIAPLIFKFVCLTEFGKNNNKAQSIYKLLKAKVINLHKHL